MLSTVRTSLARIASSVNSRSGIGFTRPLCSHRTYSTDSSGVRVLYDGECPICVKEIQFLEYLQRNRPGNVDFVDISMQGFNKEKYGGISYEMAMEEMHVIDENNKVHRGVPAFTVMYSAVGLGWLGHFMSWPLVRPVMDKAYAIFAKNRLKWTGREDCTTGRCVRKEP